MENSLVKKIMMRKVSTMLVLVILSCMAIACMLFYYIGVQAEGILTIRNNSGTVLKDSKLIYISYSDKKTVPIGDIANKKTCKHKIDDSYSIGESSITLSFEDEKGVTHSEIVVGYVYKGISSTRLVVSKSNDQFIFTEKCFR